jgi:hypothetical protein
MSNSVLSAAIERASKIKLMIFDVDGVLTDGGLRYGAEGEPEGMSDTPRTVGLVVTGLALVAMVTVFINITPPPSSRPIPTRNVPRSRPSRW